jgi:transcriptional regulator with XRE-family HTH domain
MIAFMSISTEGLSVPEWDLADRLGKSLREAKMSVQQMADYLEVHRNTVSAWTNGRTPPGPQTIRLWAMRTGVPYRWLRDGKTPPDGDGGSRLRESNPGPSHYE